MTKRYGRSTVVDDLSMSVARGEMVALVGGSGSGKTTTLKMINRLIEPSSGVVRINGWDTASAPPHELRRRVGYVFQGIGLFPHMTVAENIAITLRLLRWSKVEMARRVDELLEMVELDAKSVRHRFPSELSGGQRQRVGVARALAPRTEMLLLDEPFGALDPLTREALQQFVLRIKRETELTAVFVTHDIVEAMKMGDRIAVMHDGKLLQVDEPDALLSHPRGPYVEQLVNTLRRHARVIDALQGPSLA